MDGKWASLPSSGQLGWASEYRKNGREKLEIEVARNRVLKFDGKEIMPPKEWLDEMLKCRSRTRSIVRNPVKETVTKTV